MKLSYFLVSCYLLTCILDSMFTCFLLLHAFISYHQVRHVLECRLMLVNVLMFKLFIPCFSGFISSTRSWMDFEFVLQWTADDIVMAALICKVMKSDESKKKFDPSVHVHVLNRLIQARLYYLFTSPLTEFVVNYIITLNSMYLTLMKYLSLWNCFVSLSLHPLRLSVSAEFWGLKYAIII